MVVIPPASPPEAGHDRRPGPGRGREGQADASAHLDVAASAGDPAVQRDRYRQAAQRLGYATRILDALATPPPAEEGVPLNFAGALAPSRAPVFG